MSSKSCCCKPQPCCCRRESCCNPSCCNPCGGYSGGFGGSWIWILLILFFCGGFGGGFSGNCGCGRFF